MPPDLPSGTVTFLYTDIEGSTPLGEREPAAMRQAQSRHDAILRQAVEAHSGHVYKVIGDAIQAAFALPADALAAALDAQRELAAVAWPTSTPLRVRMGLHTGPAEAAGPAESAGPDYATTHTLNRVARIMTAAHGGQILLSLETAELARGDLPHEVTLRDLGQHRMKGLSRREHLFQLDAPDLPAEFPPLASLEAVPNNLPPQLTTFVGRQKEIAQVEELLATARLLTLTGPGGTGKTRLSLQVAAQVLDAFPDGVWLVELAPLADPALVVHSLASTLGVREQPQRPLFDVLADYLRAKTVLVLLDNCEHLVAACAEAAERLLRVSVRVKVIASSREALGIAGETTFRVPSLPVPAAEAALSPETLGQYEAARLFVERAQAALPGFALTRQNVPAVAQVCRRLDGIPLAIELAAARVKLLRVEQIAARLDDRFRLLTGGSRTALPRQQTLRALIDWSYDLLTDPERTLLRRLSVFAGGWTLEAAELVCTGDDFANDPAKLDRNRGGGGAGEKSGIPPAQGITPAYDVLDVLSRLVDKSLVVVDREQSQETRYHLLETIRQYARDKLFDAPAGEAAASRDRHLAYYLPLAEQAEPRLFGPDEVRWLEQLRAEHDNLRAALEWGLESDAEAALRLAGALYLFWDLSGHATEAHAGLTKALAQAASLPEPADEAAGRHRLMARAKALGGLGTNYVSRGDVVPGRRLLKESTDLLRTLGDQRWLSPELGALAYTEIITGDPRAAQAAAAESRAVGRASGDPWALASALQFLGNYVALAHGNFAAARADLEESVRLFRQIGSAWGAAVSLVFWAEIANAEGDYAAARLRLEECLPVFAERRDPHRLAMARSDLAHVERHQGRAVEAKTLYRQTIVAWQQLGNRAAMAHQLECLAYLARAQGQAERAARLLGAAESTRATNAGPREPSQQAEHERELAALRTELDEAAIAQAWAAGRALTLDQAVEYALSEQDHKGLEDR